MERYRELRALLRLLTHLTQRDLVDFGTAEGGATVDIAQVLGIKERGSHAPALPATLTGSRLEARSRPPWCVSGTQCVTPLLIPVLATTDHGEAWHPRDRPCSWGWTSSCLSSPGSC